jgi:hypothetical protein
MTSIDSRGAHESGERWKNGGFRQVRASMRIITIHHVFWCIMIRWVDTPPPLPLLLYAKGVGFTWKIRVGYRLPDRDSISTCLFCKIYLLHIFRLGLRELYIYRSPRALLLPHALHLPPLLLLLLPLLLLVLPSPALPPLPPSLQSLSPLAHVVVSWQPRPPAGAARSR